MKEEELAKMKRDIAKLTCDRMESAYDHSMQKINITLAVSNAAVGIILMAPNPGTLEDLVGIPAKMGWVWFSLATLGVAIAILLFQSTRKLNAPFTVEGFDRIQEDATTVSAYLDWECRRYTAAATIYDKRVKNGNKLYILATLLTITGIILYVIARCL